jgi:pyruvate,water dikinase
LFGAPQDVEWCHDGKQFWIVQSRPVTTHPTRSTDSTHPTDSTDSTHPTYKDPEWTRANLAEVLPDQTSPQVLAAYEDMLNRGQRMFMGRLLAPDAELGPMFKVFCGRMYMNLSQMRRVVALGRAPAADMLRSLGHPEAIHPDDEVAKPAPIGEFLKCLPDFIRLASYDLRAAALIRRHEADVKEFLEKIRAVDPTTLSDRQIVDMILWWFGEAPRAIQVVFAMSGVLFREVALRKACNAVGFSYERLVYTQLAAGERSVSTRQATELVVLAEVARHDERARKYLIENDGSFSNYREGLQGTTFLERFDRFLDQYGHRGRYESDWAIPRLHENPAPALFAIQQHLQSPPTDLKAVVARQNADAEAAWREFEARLTTWQRWALLPPVRALLKRLKKQYLWREQVRSDLTRIVRYVRPFHLTLANRFTDRGWIARPDDYFLLRFDEIDAAIEDSEAASHLRAIAARRTADLAAERTLRVPMLMRESELPALLRQGAPAVADTDTLTGLCVSPGAVEAEVVVMTDPAQFATMRRGAVLVAPATDPSWTPLFTLASGVIVEVGGMLSHASTIAREYGLPALANVKDATRILRTGDRVQLDASAGRVRVLSRTV